MTTTSVDPLRDTIRNLWGKMDINDTVVVQKVHGPAANDNDPLPLINPAAWQGKPVPDREWWLDGLVPMRQVTLLSGDGGVGKSLLALQLAAAGAMGSETLGIRPASGRALYLGAEDEEDEFHRRLSDVVRAHSRQLADLEDFRLVPLADTDALLASPNKSGGMEPTPLFNRVVDLVCEFAPKVVVADTAADLFGGDEIKRSQVRQFISMLRAVAIKCDCAVILLTHPSVAGMQSGTGTSGSTAWSNSARSRLYLTRPADKDSASDVRVLTSMKSNYGAVGDDLRFRWQEGAFVLDDGKPSPAAGILNRRQDEKFRELLSLMNRTGQ